MKMTRFLIISLVVVGYTSLSAEGRGDSQWIEAKDGVVSAWNLNFPVLEGVKDVRFSKADAFLMYVVPTRDAVQTVQAIAGLYKGKTIGKFTVGDFVARDDFMPDAVGFATGKKTRGQGLAIFVIPQGTDVIVHIHPFKK